MGKPQIRAGVWLCLLLASSLSASALDPSLDVSQYAHTAWKVRDGFARGEIISIAQTPDGYLWLATDLGLLRFDGVRAVPWQPPAGEKLPDDFVRTLLVSRDGTLWISTLKGLASWKDGKLTQYPEVAGQIVGPLLQDRQGTVWLGLYTPGRLCSIRGGKVECYGSGNFGNAVVAIYEDHKGALWVSGVGGLWRWAPGPPVRYSFSGGVIEANSIIEDESGTVLLATNDGLKRLVGGELQPYVLPGVTGQVRPEFLFRSSDGSLWIASQQGLFHLHRGRVDRFTRADGLSGDGIDSLFEDREGNVWAGTLNGLDRFREFAVPTISTGQGLTDSNVWSVQATEDGSVWMGMQNGLNRWRAGHVRIYGGNATGPNGQSDLHGVSTSRPVASIRNSGLVGAPQSLGRDDRGRLLVSTSEGAFYLEQSRFHNIPGSPGGNTYSITGDGHRNVWILGAQAGLFLWTPGQAAQEVPIANLPRSFMRVLLPDLSGGLWTGFFQGGLVYVKDGQIRASYGAADGLGNGAVSALRFGSKGALWAATEGGLSRIKDGHITTLTSKNGLPCDAVHWSMEDNDDAVWLHMRCGLVRISRSELDAWVSDPKRMVQTAVFDISEGVRSIGLYGGYGPHVTKSADGMIWFLPRDGVSVIDPRHLAFNRLPPPVHIEQIVADGKTYWQNLSGDASSSPPKLPPLVRDLTIDYTALSLVVPEKVHFRFKLEGQDKDWREVVNDRRVEYSNLPPRHYRFRVMACNNSGVWNEEGASLDFTIAPAYWQTNWFHALCVLALLALIWAIYHLRVRALERRQALLERNQALLEQNQAQLEQHQSEIRALNEQLIKAQEAERIRIAGELHDGVLQRITSLTLRLGTVKYQIPADSEAKASISGLQQELINIGTDVRHVSHELHPALLQEAGLPAALASYCQEFSKVRGLPVSCETDESVNELSPGAALCLYRIAQEALGNAAKYAKARKVDVRLSRSNGTVHLTVSDDGVGCTPHQAGASGGLGLINMRERVLQLHGTFAFDSAPGQGATVKVSVPFRPAA